MPTASDRRIALLGTGIMGAHMARRLAQAGFAVTAWNRNPDKAEKLASVRRQDRRQPVRGLCRCRCCYRDAERWPGRGAGAVFAGPNREKAGRGDGARLGAGGDELDPGRDMPGAGAKAGGAGRPLYRRSGVRRRARCARWHACDHGGWRPQGGRRHRRCILGDGARHPHRPGWHRADDQARQSDHCRRHHGRGSPKPCILPPGAAPIRPPCARP